MHLVIPNILAPNLSRSWFFFFVFKNLEHLLFPFILTVTMLVKLIFSVLVAIILALLLDNLVATIQVRLVQPFGIKKTEGLWGKKCVCHQGHKVVFLHI